MRKRRMNGSDPQQSTVNSASSASQGWRTWGVALVIAVSLAGCTFYGFSGASVPSHLESIAIPIAQDNTTSPFPNLGRDLTNILTDRFTGRTSFSLNNNETNADAVLRARVQRYSNRPTGVGGDERASTNTVSIRVRTRYYDQVRDSTMVEEDFTGSAEYDPTESGLDGEREAAQLALERVGEDIFTNATSSW